MASATITPYKIHISPDNTGLLGLKQTEDASKKVSELLQKDLEVTSLPSLFPVACANAGQEHHVFYNNSGFHNHVNFTSTSRRHHT